MSRWRRYTATHGEGGIHRARALRRAQSGAPASKLKAPSSRTCRVAARTCDFLRARRSRTPGDARAKRAHLLRARRPRRFGRRSATARSDLPRGVEGAVGEAGPGTGCAAAERRAGAGSAACRYAGRQTNSPRLGNQPPTGAFRALETPPRPPRAPAAPAASLASLLAAAVLLGSSYATRRATLDRAASCWAGARQPYIACLSAARARRARRIARLLARRGRAPGQQLCHAPRDSRSSGVVLGGSPAAVHSLPVRSPLAV